MAILAKEGEKREFLLVPAGTHQAVCYGVWDIGLQKTIWNNAEKIQHKVIVAFEINEQIPSGEYVGKRFTVSKRYTLSLGDKANLRKDLESWRGKAFTIEELKGFDIEKLIGINAMVSVVHNEVRNEKGTRFYANIVSVSKLMKGVMPMKPENEPKPPEWVTKLQAAAIEEVAEGGEPEQAETAGGGEGEEPLPF